MIAVIGVLIAWFVSKFFWLLVAVAVTVIGGRLIGGWLARRDDQQLAARAYEAQVCARADRQHAAVLAGDESGVYGEYPPET